MNIVTVRHREKIDKKTFQRWRLIIIRVMHRAINNNTCEKSRDLNIREIQTTFVLRCGKVGMWEWNSRKGTRREHTFFCVIQNVDFSDQLLILQLANLHILPST